MKLKGIHGEERLACGCLIKWYKGGKYIQSGCLDHPEKVVFKCTVCKKVMTKTEMKRHRWTHAY